MVNTAAIVMIKLITVASFPPGEGFPRLATNKPGLVPGRLGTSLRTNSTPFGTLAS
jgi:hypothetical protein